MEQAGFIEDIRVRYAAGRERLFILHGNTADLFSSADGTLRTLPDHLFAQITGGKQTNKIWMHFSVDSGVRWINEKDAQGVARLGKLAASESDVLFTRDPLNCLRLVKNVCSRREKVADKAGSVVPLRLVMTDAQHIVPQSSSSFMPKETREMLVFLKRFASEPFYDQTDTLIILVTDTLSAVHEELREAAVSIELLSPDEEQVGEDLMHAIAQYDTDYVINDLANMKELAIGLTTRQIQNVVAQTKHAGVPLSPAILSRRRKELVKRSYGENLEFQKPRWGFDAVGGAKTAVEALSSLAQLLASGDPDVPAGIIMAGQNGVGKSYIGEAFAHEAGINVVSIPPFKSRDYGGTARAWSKIETGLKSCRRIIVKVDEADARLGKRSGDVHETSKELISRQLEFIGDPAYVGRIFWILMTCRPDELAPDFKRPGRCDTVIPLFPILDQDEALEILRAVMKFLSNSRGYKFDMPELEVEHELMTMLIGKTGGDIKKILRKARVESKRDGGRLITTPDLEQVLRSSSRTKAVPAAYELQQLVGIVEALETGNEEMIPPEIWKQHRLDMPSSLTKCNERIRELRHLLD